MPDFAALRRDAATVLGVPVTAAGLFVLDIGRVAPTAAGLAGAAAGDAVAGALTDSTIVEGLAAGAGYAGAKHAAYQGAADSLGLTPVMVLAVAAEEVALLDWSGNVRSGTGPTRALARFPRATSTIAGRKSGPTRHVELTNDEVQVSVQCTLGLLAPGKKEMREVLDALGVE